MPDLRADPSFRLYIHVDVGALATACPVFHCYMSIKYSNASSEVANACICSALIAWLHMCTQCRHLVLAGSQQERMSCSTSLGKSSSLSDPDFADCASMNLASLKGSALLTDGC